jgi:hypothetical protein
MMVGLIQPGNISLTAWTPDVHSRAVYAQSLVRRFARRLKNDRITVHALEGPLLQQAVAAWGSPRLYVALDTSPLWNTDGVVRVSLVSRGRAVPRGWKGLAPPRSRVAYAISKDVLERVAALLPFQGTVVWTAERGFADTQLMAHLARLGWHWRLRINGSGGIDRSGKRRGQVQRMPLAPGKALGWHQVDSTP